LFQTIGSTKSIEIRDIKIKKVAKGNGL